MSGTGTASALPSCPQPARPPACLSARLSAVFASVSRKRGAPGLGSGTPAGSAAGQEGQLSSWEAGASGRPLTASWRAGPAAGASAAAGSAAAGSGSGAGIAGQEGGAAAGEKNPFLRGIGASYSWDDASEEDFAGEPMAAGGQRLGRAARAALGRTALGCCWPVPCPANAKLQTPSGSEA